MNNTRFLMVICCVMLLLCGAVSRASEEMETVAPEWQPMFDAVCAGTSEAMSLTPHELEELLNRCGQLAEQIEKLDPQRAKFYRKRLSLACNLYRFVLEEKLAATARETTAAPR